MCDWAGTTTYEVGESLAEITPTSVKRSTDGTGQPLIALTFDEAGSGALGDATRGAVQKQLAILLDGRVIAAPTVMEPITTGQLTLGGQTQHEAEEVEATLTTSATR